VKSRPAPVAIAWQATDPLPRGWRPWLTRLLTGYLEALGHPERGVTLLVGSDATLKRLNARYRRRDAATDILSFSYLDTRAPSGSASRTANKAIRIPPIIGELAVSWPRTKAQARVNGWSARAELARLLAHGCVHLVGYDHPTRRKDLEMLEVEERLLAAAGFGGLYSRRNR
jgi:probable rRNA maturation factor